MTHNSELSFIDILLKSNEPPSCEQRYLIQNELVGPKTTLLEVQTEIARVRELLENLIQKQTNLAQEIEPYEVILNSPFRKLPDDIIRKIFLACLPDDHIPIIDFRQPPLLLTQISSHLRQVAFTTHRLWTAIDIPILSPRFTECLDGREQSRMNHSRRMMAKYACAVGQWLGRTGACDIEIFVHEIGNSMATWYVEDVFQLLIARVPQWKSISLHCSAYSVQIFCNMLGRSPFKGLNFPRLKHLSINILGEYHQQDDPQEEYNNSSHLPDALFLKSICLVTPEDNYEKYRIQWSCLTYLSLGSALHPSSLNSVVKILESCASLLSCKLCIKMDNTNIHLCLPRLKAISIAFDQEAWFDSNIYVGASYTRQMETAFSFFGQLDTPMLESITYDASTEFMPLLGLVHRMGDHITHLSVTNFEVPTELMDCLKACPVLVALDVSRQDGIPNSPTRNSQWLRPALSASLSSWSTAGDQLLHYLITEDCDDVICRPLCPRLEYLAYHIGDGPITCEAIEGFIINKCSSHRIHAGLKGFSVHIRGGEQDIMRIRRSVEVQILNGLRLQLIPGKVASRLMSTSTYPETAQCMWWDDEC